MKAFKAFIKLFEAPQSSEKIKIYVNSLFSSVIGAGKINEFQKDRDCGDKIFIIQPDCGDKSFIIQPDLLGTAKPFMSVEIPYSELI